MTRTPSIPAPPRGDQEAVRWSRRFRELPRPDDGEVVLAAVGDTALVDSVYRSASRPTRTLFGLLGEADVAFAVLSGALSDWGAPARKDVVIGPVRVSEDLRAAGIDVVSLATNHFLDAGARGVAETLEALERASIARTGGGRDLESALEPARREVRGHRTDVLAFHSWVDGLEEDPSLGPTPAGPEVPGVAPLRAHRVRVGRGRAGVWPHQEDLDRMEETIRRAAGPADSLIVGLDVRWDEPSAGQGWEEAPEGLRALARSAVDAGADLVIGSGMRRLLPLERYGGGVIAYGLGNFFFQLFEDGGPARRYTIFPETREKIRRYVGRPEFFRSVVLRAVLSGDGVRRVDLVPYVLDDAGVPAMAPDPVAGEILESLAEGSGRLGTEMERDAWHGWITLAAGEGA